MVNGVEAVERFLTNRITSHNPPAFENIAPTAHNEPFTKHNPPENRCYHVTERNRALFTTNRYTEAQIEEYYYNSPQSIMETPLPLLFSTPSQHLWLSTKIHKTQPTNHQTHPRKNSIHIPIPNPNSQNPSQQRPKSKTQALSDTINRI